jgi:hypothetical protein
MQRIHGMFIAGVCLSLSATATADRVHLTGGAVIEGNAKRSGEKVIVEVESGTLSLPAASVVRIEESETPLARVEARMRALLPGDVRGMLSLADYCRDHGMRAREQELLRKILDYAPDHPEARARLGYVRTEAGWVNREEHLRASGLVKRDGRWLTPEQVLELERLEAEHRTAQLRREQAQVELEAMRAELASKKAEHAYRERERERSQQAPREGLAPDGYAAFGPLVVPAAGFPLPWPGAHPAMKPVPLPAPNPEPSPSPIPGFRDPGNMSFQVPGYRDPRSYF